MKIEAKEVDSAMVVHIDAVRLDASCSVAFKSKLSELIEGGHRKIVLDLSAVEFMDSSGLGATVAVMKAIGKGGALILCSVHDQVMKLFKLTRMDKVFQIEPDANTALMRLPE